MQKWLGFRRIVEISCFVPQHEIRDETGACRDVLAQLVQFIGSQCKPAERQTGKQNDSKYREDASDTADIELSEAEFSLAQITQNDAGNQITGNHEKDVDADKSAFKIFWKSMEEEYTEYCNGSQTVDIRTVSET